MRAHKLPKSLRLYARRLIAHKPLLQVLPRVAVVTPSTAEPVVLDTNVVLDLWLFGDGRADALRTALEAEQLGWVATERMLTELGHVLQRPFLQAYLQPWWHDPGAALTALRARCRVLPSPAASAIKVPTCRDADDQPFIDLAWHGRTRWLFSRDRALLCLAKHARPRGLHIITPDGWGMPGPALDLVAPTQPI